MIRLPLKRSKTTPPRSQVVGGLVGDEVAVSKYLTGFHTLCRTDAQMVRSGRIRAVDSPLFLWMMRFNTNLLTGLGMHTRPTRDNESRRHCTPLFRSFVARE